MTASAEETIARVSSGVMRIALLNDEHEVGSGTGFLIDGYAVTASHVLRKHPFDAVLISWGDDRPGAFVLGRDTVLNSVAAESGEDEHDLVLLHLDEPEMDDRHRFQVGNAHRVRVGEQVIFLGYPFGSNQLAAHVGYISASYIENRSHVFQLDGSANPSNSGGPVLETTSGDVIGCVVRAQTGLMKDFDQLVETLGRNVEQLSNQRATMTIGGVDPVQGLRASMAAMRELALNMRRSANVGIAYATSAEHLDDLRTSV